MTTINDPGVRAIVDRLIMDVANIRVLADCVPNPGPERKVPATGWTIRQTFWHLASGMDLLAAGITRVVEGGPPFLPGWDQDAANARSIEEAGATSIAEICDRIAAGRDAVIDAARGLTEDHLAIPVGSTDLETVLARIAMHLSVHALEVAEALGDARFDPFLLNWLCGCDLPPGDESSAALRERLVRDARAHYGIEADA